MVNPVADASQGTLSWAVESTFKTPATGTYQKVRMISDSLGRDPEVIQSDEIDGDRQVVDNILAFIQAGGGVPVEFSYGAHDDWLRYALLSGDWAGAAANPGPDIQVLVTATETTFRLASGAWTSFVVGQIVRSGGFTNSENNGYWKVTDISGLDLTCAGVGVAEGSGGSRTVQQCDQIVTGTAIASMTIERGYSIASNIAQLPGMTLAGFSIDASKRDKVRGEFRFLGATEQTITSSPGSGYTAAPTNRVFSVNGHLATFAFNNDRSARLTSFRLDYDNGLYVIDDAGYSTPEAIGIGDAKVEGNYEFWYRDGTVFDRVEDFADCPFLVAFEDSAGNGLGFEVLASNLGPARRVTPGKSQGVIGTTQYMGKKHPTELITLRMFRRAAP